MNRGFIKLPRDIINSAWYHKGNTIRVYLHLVLLANISDCMFETHTVHWGQVATSRKSLADSLHLSVQEVRTALTHLKTTGEITIETTSKFLIVTINHFEKFCVDKY